MPRKTAGDGRRNAGLDARSSATTRILERLDRLAGTSNCDPASVDWDELFGALTSQDTPALERSLRRTLQRLPVPLGLPVQDAAMRHQRLLQRAVAELAARRGEPEERLDLLRDEWLDAGRPLPYLEQLLLMGRNDEAAASARLALAHKQCPERAAIEALLEQTGEPPPGWSEGLRQFARDPSVEAWDELMRFTPLEALYQRVRNTLQELLRLGADADILFLCATRHGTVPDAIELVERGLVRPETVVRRAEDGPPGARACWLGLAAQAAAARGDRLGTVRLLRQAYGSGEASVLADVHAMAIRDHADEELQEMLDRAKLPRFR